MMMNLQPEQTVFMPGCSLRKIAPDLDEKAYAWLKHHNLCSSRYNGCCGQPYNLRGKADKYLAVVTKLSKRLSKANITAIITACPNCYYSLKESFSALGSGVKMYALPEILVAYGCAIEEQEGLEGARYTIHDSCPDREGAVFGDAVRSLMRNLNVVEMEHHQKTALCCGAGSEFIDLDFDEKLVQASIRLAEAETIDADVVVTACASCTFTLCAAESNLPACHYLSLLFDCWD